MKVCDKCGGDTDDLLTGGAVTLIHGVHCHLCQRCRTKHSSLILVSIAYSNLAALEARSVALEARQQATSVDLSDEFVAIMAERLAALLPLRELSIKWLAEKAT